MRDGQARLDDIDGWLNRHTGTWHAIRTCARTPADLLPLMAALNNDHDLCGVCCPAQEWFEHAQEVAE